MNRIRALAVVCSLAILVGSSGSLATLDEPRDVAETPEQATVSFGRAESGDVRLVPDEHRLSRDQSAFFVVRIDGLPANQNAFLVGLRTKSPLSDDSYEFHDEIARVGGLPRPFPESDVLVYVWKTDDGEMAHVPVTVVPESKLELSGHTVEAEVWTKDFRKVGEAKSSIQVRCTVECRVDLFVTWLGQEIELVVAILGLLVTFFGRKRIWDALGFPRERESGVEGSEQTDADAVGDGQHPDG